MEACVSQSERLLFYVQSLEGICCNCDKPGVAYMRNEARLLFFGAWPDANATRVSVARIPILA